MKKRLSSFLLAITLFGIYGCDAQTPTSATVVAPATATDTLDNSEFTSEQFHAFDEALKPWYEAKYYGECMARDHFRVNCYDCETVGVDVVLQIDSQGKIVQATGLGYNIYCIGKTHSEKDKQEFYDCMMLAIPKLVLTPPFYGKIIRVFIGDHLGC